MVAYAGATWDWHRLHYDPEFVAAARLPAPVVDGQVFGALLVELLQDWLGPRCFVHELHFRFKNLVFAGETVRCEGTRDRGRRRTASGSTLGRRSTWPATTARSGAARRARRTPTVAAGHGRRCRARDEPGVAIVGAAECDLGVTGQVDPRRCRPRRSPGRSPTPG